MEKDVSLGEGVGNSVKATVNRRTTETFEHLINIAFNIINNRIDRIPGKVEQIFNDNGTKNEIINQWTAYLYEQNLIPKGYMDLPDDLLIKNLHQEGYVDGLYAGLLLSLMAMVDNDSPKDLVLAVRNDVRPFLIEHHYDDRGEFFERYKNEKYQWIDKEPQ